MFIVEDLSTLNLCKLLGQLLCVQNAGCGTCLMCLWLANRLHVGILADPSWHAHPGPDFNPTYERNKAASLILSIVILCLDQVLTGPSKLNCSKQHCLGAVSSTISRFSEMLLAKVNIYIFTVLLPIPPTPRLGDSKMASKATGHEGHHPPRPSPRSRSPPWLSGKMMLAFGGFHIFIAGIVGSKSP